ncbi:MAG: hypothetical protein KJO82_08560 [Gammaproteobacteria bacterium]|nr:hypothetical protein [Gammaproteobacteria bacterium]
MKYVLALLFGAAVGGCIAMATVYFNPFSTQASLSPLSVSGNQQLVLNYSAVAADSILFTNNGEAKVRPHPSKVLQLWEAPIRQSDTRVTLMRDGRNQPVGIGIKFSSLSERTKLLQGEALVDSAWYIFMPGQGSLLIEQSENHWPFLREIVLPAYMSSADNWRGNWHGTITDGPGALGTARVFGGSGRFLGMHSDAIETLSATAYSAEVGPVAMDGQLTIELQTETADVAESRR